MKKITMFYFPSCPHCQKALRLIEELKGERAEFANIEIEMIDEKKSPEIADRFDYYYVPTFFVDGKKLHEGTPSKNEIEAVLAAAIN